MTTTQVVTSEMLTANVRGSLRTMLDEAFDDDFSDHDWAHALGGWHAVVLDELQPVAHASVVERRLDVAGTPFRAGYVEAVATSADWRQRGLGSVVMGELGSVIEANFELGALSTGVHDFYARFGWERWLGPTAVRHGTGIDPTPDDDGALMVLRFGPSAVIDLCAPISCDARPGADW